MRLLVRCLAVLAIVTSGVATAVTARAADTVVTVTDGGAPGWVRFDTSGNALDAHDGEIKQFSYVGKTKVAPRYYLYGTAYSCGYVRMHGYAGDTRPVTPFCGFIVYESTDLRHWKYDGRLFDPNTTTPTNWQNICNSATLSCYRPHVLYDAAAGRYVLWVNTYDVDANGVQHGYHVLTSTSPKGPFTEVTDASGHAALPNLAYPTGGDFDLYQDSDRAHTGYIAYAVQRDPERGSAYTYRIVVEKLSRDYLTGTGTAGATELATRHTEAPSLFRRGSDYYLTMADPFCAYCAGTGTAYMRAHTPLGAWHGPTGYGAPSLRGMLLDGRGGMFQGRDSSDQAQQTISGLSDYDLTFRVRPQLDFNAGTQHWARAGWMFRAKDLGNGYLWILSNRPRGSAPASLLKEKLVNGDVTWAVTVPVSVPLPTDRFTTITTRAVGPTIQTFVNGTLVDTTTDSTFTSGYTGLRERPGDAGWYDDVLLQSPATAGPQTTYLAENFDDGSLAAFGPLETAVRHGYKISSDSCGAQPDDVAMLTAPVSSDTPTGYDYLYQSDRWDYADQNEAQATQYWEPLKFASDGSIQPLVCGSVYTMVLNAATASTSPVGGFDKALDGFGIVQDINATRSRGESFLVAKNETLTSVKVTVFQTDDSAGNAPNAGLTLSLYDVDSSGRPTGNPIAQAGVPATKIAWTPHVVSVPMHASLTRNANGSAHRYALVLSSPTTAGPYGTVRNDGTAFDAVAGSAGLVLNIASDGSAQWTAEPRRDVRIVPVATVP